MLAERHGIEPSRVFVTAGGLQGFVFYRRRAVRRRPARAGRGADVRPAAELLALRGRRGGRLPMDAEGLDSTPSRRSSGVAGRLVSVHDPDLPESIRPDTRRRATGRLADRHGTRLACSRTTRMARTYEGRLLRFSTSSKVVSGQLYLVLLEDRGAGFAGRLLVVGAELARPTTIAQSRPTSRRRFSPRRSCSSSRVGRVPVRISNGYAGCLHAA